MVLPYGRRFSSLSLMSDQLEAFSVGWVMLRWVGVDGIGMCWRFGPTAMDEVISHLSIHDGM